MMTKPMIPPPRKENLPDLPFQKNILVINTPYLFAEEPLCPYDLVPVGILKIVAFLKKRKNSVHFIDMASSQKCLWKKMPAGRNGGRRVQMFVMGRPREYLEKRLMEIGPAPDEIWVSCVFTFDYQVARSIVMSCRERFPGARIRLGGDATGVAPGIARELGAEPYFGRVSGADLCAPDFSVKPRWDYGLFQLTIGCIHRCSFCVVGKQEPAVLPVKDVIAGMERFYRRFQPGTFYNWDPNTLIFRHHFEVFLERLARSRIRSTVLFGKGFQPNLFTRSLAQKMAARGRVLGTFPIEAADSKTARRLNKPYTIISSIKMLENARQEGLDLKRCPSTFLIGYPEDDFASIFRGFLAVLRFNGNPTPFPVFLFPGTADHRRYKRLIRHKDLSELHGQLWPLARDKDVPMYRRLLRFLTIKDLEEAKKAAPSLIPELQKIFFEQLKEIDPFIFRCLNAARDTIGELQKIEVAMRRKKLRREENLLYIVANPKPLQRSTTRQLGKAFFDSYRKFHPNVRVTTLDLYKTAIGFAGEEFLDFLFSRKKKIGPGTNELIHLADRFIWQLKCADKIVLAAPMWTMSIPAILKAYFEIVASTAFYKRKEKFDQKPVLCVLSRDDIYLKDGQGAEREGAWKNVQEKTITAAFDFIGIGKQITFVCAEGMGGPPEARSRSVAQAKKELAAFAKEF